MAEVPGPCRHSITREHLLTVRQLVGVETTLKQSPCTAQAEMLQLLFPQMDNQLRSGCSINYTFIERRSLVGNITLCDCFSPNTFDLGFPLTGLCFSCLLPCVLISNRANVAL